MITRRDLIIGSALSVGFSHVVSGAESLAAADGGAELFALPGKRPLIRKTFRPPNYETPESYFREAFTPNDAFFVRYHSSNIPEADLRTWRLNVHGASAQRRLSLSIEDLQRNFPRVSVAAVNLCSGNRRSLANPRVPGVQWGRGAMGNALWGGVRLSDVLRAAGVGPDALEVVFAASDKPVMPKTPAFEKSLPIDYALAEHALIAFEMNSEPLPRWHGAPARLVVPGWTATYWVKHLNEIRIEPRAFDNFWMKTAYRVPTGLFPGAAFRSQETAETQPITEIIVNSMVTSHRNGERLERRAPTEVAGWAWDGGSGIATVEVSADEGKSWRKAKLGEDLGRFAWRGFRWQVDTAKAGPIRLWFRATSRSGARQGETYIANASGFHHNAIQVLSLEVS